MPNVIMLSVTIKSIMLNVVVPLVNSSTDKNRMILLVKIVWTFFNGYFFHFYFMTIVAVVSELASMLEIKQANTVIR